MGDRATEAEAESISEVVDRRRSTVTGGGGHSLVGTALHIVAGAPPIFDCLGLSLAAVLAQMQSDDSKRFHHVVVVLSVDSQRIGHQSRRVEILQEQFRMLADYD